MIVLLVVLIALGALVLFALLAGGTGLAVLNASSNRVIDPNLFVRVQDEFVLRPEYLALNYHVPVGEEVRYGNEYYIGEFGQLEGKTFIVETGRVDGWKMRIKRNSNKDIAPAVYESYVEVYETSAGASLALSPEWFWAYNDEARKPDAFVNNGCNIGQECLLFTYEDFDPATGLVTERYDVAFRYHNVITWVSGRGLDVEINEADVINAAQTLYDRLQTQELVNAE
jgi:hypothetical protein